ncbi:NAD(P)-dependent alcohol dehydrogenase [Fulvivirgaceae bacterium BMA10]|uniref:NAD(P)-dependent alcohol dehydrogenase n=1 Tax=Splendidivirga corallicola TaxID=3051826 RepID=A0ABT8KR98_9BACT|nr:NAD(P)-dependent alcohol dehydrogenase [Fulvivirgaceae bacterium BMA10]
MKAIVYYKYGSPDVLELTELEKPIPNDNEVLIRTKATTATSGDCEIRSFTFPILFWLPLRIMFGIIKPKKNILGLELAGEIEAVGKEVKQFKKGDQVFACTSGRFGAYAEYTTLPEKYAIAIKPSNMSFEEAASVPSGGLNALHYLRKGNISKGQKVLINGAGGNFGTIAVQLAKYFGTEVTAVDSEDKLDMLREIGADHVIDYAKEDFTERGKKYDIIFDVVGKSPFSRSIRSLKENGHYVIAIPSLFKILRGLWISKTSSKKVIFEFAKDMAEDLIFLKELIEKGAIKPVIDRYYPMKQMAEAHRYVESGRKKGNVVVSLANNNGTGKPESNKDINKSEYRSDIAPA